MRIPTDREAVLLRLIEICQNHAPFLGIAAEREQMERDWYEVAPTALRVRDELKEELQSS